MTFPRVVFADTSFYLAALWRRDPRHSIANAWQSALQAAGTRTVTTEAVLWELLNALSYRPTRSAAHAAYERLHLDSTVEVVGFDPALYEDARKLYADRDDKDWGITDCLSFMVMRGRGITDALTADHHFEQAGFGALLLHDPLTWPM